jgi:hypothetical protein
MNTREMTQSGGLSGAWNRSIEWTSLGRLVLLMATGLLVTNLGLPQYITGPLVNALLILAVLWAGVSQALFVGMVTPMGAALSGVLPLPLWIMIPFIALSNAVLVSLFGALRSANRWVALGIAAVAKFAVLYLAVTLLVAHPLNLMISGQAQAIVVPQAIVAMMTWPQLLTAVAGGVVAFGVEFASPRLGKKA